MQLEGDMMNSVSWGGGWDVDGMIEDEEMVAIGDGELDDGGEWPESSDSVS